MDDEWHRLRWARHMTIALDEPHNHDRRGDPVALSGDEKDSADDYGDKNHDPVQIREKYLPAHVTNVKACSYVQVALRGP